MAYVDLMVVMTLPARGANASQFVGLADEIDAGLVVAPTATYASRNRCSVELPPNSCTLRSA